MKFIIQSYVDVITNSSTSVFTWATDIAGVKKVIDGVLKAVGSTLTATDLFDINIEYVIDLSETGSFYFNKLDELIQDGHSELEEFACERLEILSQPNSASNWREYNELEKRVYDVLTTKYGVMTLNEYAEHHNDGSSEWKYSSQYTFTAKDPNNEMAANCLESINHLFNYDACYC